MIQANPVPMLWVIPPDLIEDTSSEFLASIIGRMENTDVWKFESGAIAFSLPDVLVKRGIPIDYDEAFLKRTRPLFQTIIDPHTTQDCDALDLEIPGSKYWSRISLKPEETNRRSCRYIKSHLKEWEPFAFKVYSSYELRQSELENVRNFFTDWLSNASKKSVHGESLSLGKVEIAEYSAPRTKQSYPELGFKIRCSDYKSCTWPWIDFYLQVRQKLPATQRLSVEFFNP